MASEPKPTPDPFEGVYPELRVKIELAKSASFFEGYNLAMDRVKARIGVSVLLLVPFKMLLGGGVVWVFFSLIPSSCGAVPPYVAALLTLVNALLVSAFDSANFKFISFSEIAGLSGKKE
jgi:hypothetical protein